VIELNSYQKRILRYTAIIIGAVTFYILLVYSYFHFESFGSDQSDIGFIQAVWYVFLNPTGLGDAGALKLFPATLPGKLIGVVFAVSGLSLIGLFVGKVTDMFNEYREYRRLGYYGCDFEDHVLVIGWDEFSRRIVRQLVLSGVKVAVITNVKAEVDTIYEQFDDEEVFVLYTDYEKYDRLSLASIQSARQVFLNRTADTDTLITLLNFHNHFEDLNLEYVVRANNDELLPAFDIDGIHVDAVSTFEVASALIASHIFEPDVASFGKDLIASAADRDDYEIQQFLVTAENPWAGSSFEELYWDLYENHRIIPIGLGKRKGKTRQLIELPGDDVAVETGDYVIMIVSGKTAQSAEELFEVTEGVRS
jgi:voltage-gated potassium channel